MTIPNIALVVISIIIGVIFTIRKVFENHALVRKHDFRLKIISIFILFCLIGYMFYQKGLWIGLVAVGMGALAIAKYAFDTRKGDNS
jgi:hypothetical protein